MRAGVFTLSFDFELIWGTRDLFGPDAFRSACLKERTVIGRILDLLVRYDIPATWAVVGHLFLDRCGSVGGVRHPEIVRPHHRWFADDWFVDDPGSDEDSDPVYYAKSLVSAIQKCAVGQEIGCHTFSHAVLGDCGCSRETAETEVLACLSAAERLGIELRSFVFPRNIVGHLDVLARHGFRNFRGPGPKWYERRPPPTALDRVGHLLESFICSTPPVVRPRRTAEGLWNVPGSMVWLPPHGLRRLVPVAFRVIRAVRGLEAAARAPGVFHLWVHPTSLAERSGAMLPAFERVLERAAQMRADGRLRIVPMESTVGAMGF